ncbi:MAG TPA: HAMP domain-containing protein [Firmicutes bacterium]|nr:HAMP domain-containing protein [Bacillota bacterium]
MRLRLRLNDLTLRAQLALLVLGLVMGLAVLGAYNTAITAEVASGGRDIFQTHLRGVQYSLETSEAFQALAAALNQHLNAATPDEYAAAERQVSAATDRLHQALKRGRAVSRSREEQAALQTAAAALAEYERAIPSLLEASRAGRSDEAHTLALKMHQTRNTVAGCLERLKNLSLRAAEEENARNEVLAGRARRNNLVAVLLVSLVYLALALLVPALIVRPLHEVRAVAEALARGDLTRSIVFHGQNEIGTVAAAVNASVFGLRKLARQILAASEEVATTSDGLSSSAQAMGQAAEQLALTVDQVAKGSDSQARAVQDVTRLVDRLSQSVAQLAGSAEQMRGDAATTSSIAAQGREAVVEAVRQMGAIKQASLDAAQVVQGLGRRSQEIGQIVELISAVSDQTNLLALNAAIEAARAGEQGRGFAVVAEEVRKLAEQAREATERISSLIREVQDETAKAVASMEAGTQVVGRGEETIARTGSSFASIAASVEGLVARIGQVSASAEGLANGFRTIARTMQDIASVTEEAAAGAEEAATSTEEQSASAQEIAASANQLASLAAELKEAAGRFQVPARSDQILELAKSDHLAWTGRIRRMLEGTERSDADKVRDHHLCRLGKWYFGDGQAGFGHLDTFKKLDQVHAAFHQTCAEAIRLHNVGDSAGARQKAAEIDRLSQRVIGLLDELKAHVREG